MTKFNKIEEIEVWKEAISLAGSIYQLSKENRDLSRDYGLREQIQRSSISIASNIAEGFERETNPEFIRFLYVAKGSCGELRTQLLISRNLGYISEERYKELNEKCRKISGMIGNLIKRLREKKF